MRIWITARIQKQKKRVVGGVGLDEHIDAKTEDLCPRTRAIITADILKLAKVQSEITRPNEYQDSFLRKIKKVLAQMYHPRTKNRKRNI